MANQVATGGKKAEFKTARTDREFHRTAEAKSRQPSSPPQSKSPLLFARVTNGPPQGGLFSPLDLSRDDDFHRISRAYRKSLYGLQGSQSFSERGSARLCVLFITKFFTAPANSPTAQAKHKSSSLKPCSNAIAGALSSPHSAERQVAKMAEHI